MDKTTRHGNLYPDAQDVGRERNVQSSPGNALLTTYLGG